MVLGALVASWEDRPLQYFMPMNGVRYKMVLENHLLPFMKLHKTQWFLQDRAPCHKCKVVMSRLKEMENTFGIMDC
jgi:hypothetical protein